MFSSPVKHAFKIMFVTKKSVITTASECIEQEFKAPVKKIQLVAFWWTEKKNMPDLAKVLEVVYHMERLQRGARTWKQYNLIFNRYGSVDHCNFTIKSSGILGAHFIDLRG